ncbi:MAG: hypothetical protein EPN31_07790 [Castellaniella sp.]|uniref:hypothetical protein n=1 Tax=Castellaniella sp. TaxID=1955812 RepID=UPI0012203EFE|nr:hypothetical protein [Castellaniella sp.]TAN28679.1 MAG: hypothetical protein EPN31_07790 [Castellaniella sp.]
MATKKSIWAITGLVLILAVWEVNGTLVERRNVLHEEGADVVQHAAGRNPIPHSATDDAASGQTADHPSSPTVAGVADAHSQH